MKGCIVVVGLLAFMSTPAWGQYIFLDADGDGRNTEMDVVKSEGQTTVDVWLYTNEGRDGVLDSAIRSYADELSIGSYEFILKADGGTVAWGPYVNAMAGMSVPFRVMMSDTEFYTGYGGRTLMPPGKYKLGTLTVTAVSGRPSLRFAGRGSLRGHFSTSFGSAFHGKQGDHALRLTEASLDAAQGEGLSGDWTDAVGLAYEGTATSSSEGSPEFSERLSGRAVVAHVSQDGCIDFRTGMRTKVRLRVFDVAGRLVATPLEGEVEKGMHHVRVKRTGGAVLASGIYLYKLEAAGRVIVGRLPIVK